MLYQQGLTELIHSSPSEQVAYLLVERASLLEMNQDPGDGDPESRLRTHAEPLNPVICAVGETVVLKLLFSWCVSLIFKVFTDKNCQGKKVRLIGVECVFISVHSSAETLMNSAALVCNLTIINICL